MSTFGFGSVNRVVLVGNVGKQAPEVRSVPTKPSPDDKNNAGGENVTRQWATFSLATSENVRAAGTLPIVSYRQHPI